MIPQACIRWGALALVFGLVFAPLSTRAAEVAADKLPAARIVEETRAELTKKGCVEQALTQDRIMVDVPPGKPYRVAARDRLTDTIHFCSIEDAATLTVVPGAVAASSLTGAVIEGTIEWLKWQTGSALQFKVADTLLGGKLSDLQKFAGSVGDSAESFVVEKAATAIANIITEVGTWVFDMAMQLVIFALTPSTFITNALVTRGWPLIQGIANVGFLVALLFIAFSTTLNLEIGGGR